MSVKLKPVTRILYWNRAIKRKWQSRLKRISAAYNNTELSTVIAGLRRVYVYHVRSEDFEKSFDFLRNNNMVFFPTNKSAAYHGFSHRHLPVEKGKPYHVYGAAVKNDDLEAGKLFEKYSKESNHVALGNELLGYPTCDTGFFDKVWPGIVDPIFEAALDTPGMVHKRDKYDEVAVNCHPYCNQMLRYFGVRITPHLSHSMQCEDTIKMGEDWVDIMKQIDAEATKWAIELLSMPLTWNCYKGIAEIDTPVFKGITNSNIQIDRKVVINKGWSKDV